MVVSAVCLSRGINSRDTGISSQTLQVTVLERRALLISTNQAILLDYVFLCPIPHLRKAGGQRFTH